MIGLELSPRQRFGGVRRADPLSAFFAPGGGTTVAVSQGLNGGLAIWTEIGPQHAACLRLDNVDPATRLSWRETLIAELRNVYPVGALTLTGAWSQMQSSGSGLADSYTGNRAVSTASVAATAEVTVNRSAPYDLWVHFTGRTSGGYAKVEIDGAQALVNEIDDPTSLGFKAFSSYHPTDLKRRLSVKVASGLTGSHMVRVSNGGVAVPGGNALMLEAISITGSLSDPHILPPLWQAGVSYSMGDEVCSAGTFYSARASGISGATGPTHVTGIASDGALDWRADNRPTYPAFVAMDYASEREYAARFQVQGVATDVGGQTHGNETLLSRTITLDGTPWLSADAGSGLHVGSQIAISETTTWQMQAGGDIATCSLLRNVAAGTIRHDVTISGTGLQATIEWLYAGMLPLVHWDGESKTGVAQSVTVGEGDAVELASYAGVNPPNLVFADKRRIGVAASFSGAPFAYGMEAGLLPVTGNNLEGFDTFLRPNLDARAATGSLDWAAKAYVQAVNPDGLVIGAGDSLGFFNRHVIAMVTAGSGL